MLSAIMSQVFPSRHHPEICGRPRFVFGNHRWTPVTAMCGMFEGYLLTKLHATLTYLLADPRGNKASVTPQNFNSL
jgi:hypothetical protein